jgi:preprotein translocase subunit SecG
MVIITIIHVLVCFALVLIVLLQAGKGAEMGAAFGGASQTLFGSAGAMGFLSKLTTVAAVIFMITSLLLAFSSARRGASVIQEQPVQKEAPAQPERAPEPPAKAPEAPKTPVPEKGK